MLSSFHGTMFPQRSVPANIDALVGAFMGTNALVDFSHAQTLFGAKTVLALS